MNSKVLAAIIAIIIIIIVVVAAVVVMDDDDDNGNDTPSETTESEVLQVFGNANNDLKIDNDDVKLVQRIISDNLDWKTDYPYADANHDGKVDQSDVDKIRAIMDASADNQVEIYIQNYASGVTGGYVDTVKYPITSALANSNQTTAIVLKTLAIDTPIKGMSYYYAVKTASDGVAVGDADQTQYDKYVYADYFDVMKQATRAGAGSASVYTDMSQSLTDQKCTAYIMSASNSKFKEDVYSNIKNNLGLDVVQVQDGAGDRVSFCNAVAMLGFLFGGEYYQNALNYIDWTNNFFDDFNERISKVTEKKNVVAASHQTRISAKNSSNVTLLVQAGLNCPVSGVSAKSGDVMTLTYEGGKDTWLNYLNLDAVVVLKGSAPVTKTVDGSSMKVGWSWFDKDYATADLPPDFAKYIQNYTTLDCYDNCIVLSTMLPAPLKAGVLADYYYTDLFEDGWIEGYVSDYLKTYWGFSDSQVQGQKYLLTKTDVMGS